MSPPFTTWREVVFPLLEDDAFQRLVGSRPIQENATRKVSVRPIQVGARTNYQITMTRGSQEFHENCDLAGLKRRLEDWFDQQYRDAHVFLSHQELILRQGPDGSWKIRRKQVDRPPSPREHNRTKAYLIPADVPCPFLIEAGIMTPQGAVKPNHAHKFRQINRYLEFVNDVVDHLPSEGVLRVVDYGSGKSSLTYAVHYLLTRIHERHVEMIGLDTKADVLRACEATARKLNLEGLSFQSGTIADFKPAGPIHLAISLHACDTATDDALACALAWSADVILAVPCCQHQLNQLIPATVWPGLLQFGLVRERFASLATDSLRACFLEACGYSTQLLEFIDLEHTPKNILIRAVRKPPSEDRTQKAWAVYDELMQALSIPNWALEAACAARGIARRI